MIDTDRGEDADVEAFAGAIILGIVVTALFCFGMGLLIGLVLP